MGTHILFRRGDLSDLPQKAPSGMPLWCEDKEDLYIGTGNSLAKISTRIPPGAIFFLAANNVPEGYLLCNGGAISRTVYNELFVAIGTLYGAGDGATTFNTPNLTTSNYRYIKSGTNVGSVVGESLLSHTHTFSATTNKPSLTGGFYQTGALISSVYGCVTTDTNWRNRDDDLDVNGLAHIHMDFSHNHSLSGTTGATGSSHIEVNSLVLLPCIKY